MLGSTDDAVVLSLARCLTVHWVRPWTGAGAEWIDFSAWKRERRSNHKNQADHLSCGMFLKLQNKYCQILGSPDSLFNLHNPQWVTTCLKLGRLFISYQPVFLMILFTIVSEMSRAAYSAGSKS